MMEEITAYHFHRSPGLVNSRAMAHPSSASDVALRHALGRFATGVTVITTRTADGHVEGLTANSFAAVSLDPPLVLWSLRRASPALPRFLEARKFSVNVLGTDQHGLSRHFATPAPDKFRDVAFEQGALGCPLLPGSIAVFECIVTATIDGGDHVIFLGAVEHFATREGEPLIFATGRYCAPAVLEAA